ncbi:hypothetical protein ROJ8625_01157 [Roseivivax jejudonensis]|uniref:Methylenetetrahydrofolate reductase n=1 Tax=Roseivivax jejudonensis TaxID=1529041 RepID=A0A1X6YPW7_9RHOB|nr:5,10-methylenetetrahydrofolate reductase [Roseivivax jejudonensis]SLN27859.1 hypothetical protein ROJ8625_01157 [Roseivivax jejudonensis]
MTLLPFSRRAAGRPRPGSDAALAAMAATASVEVMPRTLAKVEDLPSLLPRGTRVYIAHIDGTSIEDMVAAAARLSADGYTVMPHFPARIIADTATLDDWIRRYRDDAGVSEALLLAGGVATPHGAFHSSMQLLETGLYDKHGFTRLHVAGHPEGNRDIDPDGGDAAVMEALRWKQAFAERSDAEMGIVTQFAFESEPLIAWADRLRDAGITMPIHLGLAGPAKLQTLVRFAVTCGVGPSLRVLQRRAADVTKLVKPFEPTALAAEIAAAPRPNIAGLHLFPLGGIAATATWLAQMRGDDAARAAQRGGV